MPPLTSARAASEAPPTLLETLARAPAAAALVVAALDQKDRKALRLAHSELRDFVDVETSNLGVNLCCAAPARPPMPRRWPRLEELRVFNFDLAALESLGSETWGGLRSLHLRGLGWAGFDMPRARALAAALRHMPALRALELRHVLLPDAPAAELFRARPAPHLRTLRIVEADLTPAAARALAATGWPLEELDLFANPKLGAAGLAPILAAPTFALRRLELGYCGLGAADILALANAPWPLEELKIFSSNDLSDAPLAALARHARLRRLDLYCKLSAAGFQALVEAAWPRLASLRIQYAKVAFDGPDALGAAAFAAFPALEELDLCGVLLGEAGARLLASWLWPRLRKLELFSARLGDAGLAALARGEWPALEVLDLRYNSLGAPLALEDARHWAPALVKLIQ